MKSRPKSAFASSRYLGAHPDLDHMRVRPRSKLLIAPNFGTAPRLMIVSEFRNHDTSDSIGMSILTAPLNISAIQSMVCGV